MINRAGIMISICIILGIIDCSCTKKPNTFVSIQYRFVDEKKSKESRHYVSKESGETIFVHQEVMLDQNNIKTAVICKDEYSRNAICIQFNKDGTEKLNNMTAERNREKSVALLIDDELYHIAVIREPITTGKAIMASHALKNDQITDILKRLNR